MSFAADSMLGKPVWIDWPLKKPEMTVAQKTINLVASLIHSIYTQLRLLPGDRRVLIVISGYRYRRKSLYTSIVAGTVKLYRYNRNIVINVIVINGVECSS